MKSLITALFVFSSLSLLAAEVDKKKSSFQWKGTKKVGSFHTGNISIKSATVKMAKNTISNATVVMDMNSITNEDIKGGLKNKFLGHVKSGDFFEVAKYPTASFTFKEQVKDSTFVGKLTIKGKTNPVTVKYSKKGKTYSGTLQFDRTKFGIVYGSQNFFKKLVGDKIINDLVTVTFKLAMK